MAKPSFSDRISFGQLLVGLALLNFFWRLVFLPFSDAAYTDGVLQIDMFGRGLTYWPPLYAILTRLVAQIPGLELESAARLLSMIFGSIAVIPTGLIARQLFGQRAAVFACLVYLASPIPLRWSMQVMTDAPFMAIWMGSLAFTLQGCQKIWPELFDQAKEKTPVDLKAGGQCLLLGALAGALATLTRYQGIFLFPVGCLVALAAGRTALSAKERPGMPMGVSILPWLVVPIWILRNGLDSVQVHLEQISQRSSAGTWSQTLLNYWWYLEEFVLDSPYYLTWSVFGFFLYGLFRIQYTTKRIRLSAWAALYLSAAIFGMHAVFQAFQTRYLLPLVPLVCVIAGHGLSVWQRRCAERPGRFWMLAGPAFAYAILFSSLVAFQQGTPFLDIKQAGEYLRNLPEDTRIFSTEIYNRKIGAAKLEFWSGGRKIEYLAEGQPLAEGDYIVLPSVYGSPQGGGWLKYSELRRIILSSAPTTEVQQFAYVSYPLLPDIMEEPETHVNPLAFHLRYFRQNFQTSVIVVGVPETAESGLENAAQLP